MPDSLPEKFWSCCISLKGAGENDYAVVNDLSLTQLMKAIVTPWHAGKRFSVGGLVIRNRDDVGGVRIFHSQESKEVLENRYDAHMARRNIADLATDRRMLPFEQGDDYTHELLFEEIASAPPSADVALVLALCRRLHYAAKILGTRRNNRPPFPIANEYDVQDLMHALIRAYIKYTVQEDPIGKFGAAKHARADISIEELGIIIELKFVYRPEDQKRILKEFSEDLLLYTKWKPLQTLIFVIYNSGDLREPEAFEKLNGVQDIAGQKFSVHVVLV